VRLSPQLRRNGTKVLESDLASVDLAQSRLSRRGRTRKA
jgi:hypothetical protein